MKSKIVAAVLSVFLVTSIAVPGYRALSQTSTTDLFCHEREVSWQCIEIQEVSNQFRLVGQISEVDDAGREIARTTNARQQAKVLRNPGTARQAKLALRRFESRKRS